MDLNERKIKILQAIINDYIMTAEPVGSRTIAKKYDLGISSATIRNEMADLEDLGFIVQPHTSAGRIPSDRGYRLYVDQLMEKKQMTEKQILEVKELLNNKINNVESLMQEIARMLSVITNYTTLVSEPQIQKTKLKHMQLIYLDEKSAILVIITDENIIKNHIINMSMPADQDTLYKLSNMMNQYLHGLTLEQINLPLIQTLKHQMGSYSEMLSSVLDAVAETIQTVDKSEVYMSGANKLLDYPEFSNVGKAQAIFHTLETKEKMNALLMQNDSEDIRISIGDENNIDGVKECSVITTIYKIGEQTYGNIGIIGPTRMDYAQVVSTLAYISKQMDQLVKRVSSG